MNKIILFCGCWLILCMAGCHWEEEPAPAELYAGRYSGVMEIYPVSGGEGYQLRDKDVVIAVAGDHRLSLHVEDISIAGMVIGSFALQTVLSNDGLNRISGQLGGILLESGGLAHADVEGTVAYGRSDWVIYITVETEQAGDKDMWAVKFSGKRK